MLDSSEWVTNLKGNLENEVQKIELDNQKYDYLLLKSGIYYRFH